MSACKKWWFSLGLGFVYLAVFLFWQMAERGVVIISGLLVAALAMGAWLYAARTRYFFNRTDAFLHTVLILDIFLEGVLVSNHDWQGFYLCALAFAVVIGGYRAYASNSWGAKKVGR